MPERFGSQYHALSTLHTPRFKDAVFYHACDCCIVCSSLRPRMLHVSCWCTAVDSELVASTMLRGATPVHFATFFSLQFVSTEGFVVTTTPRWSALRRPDTGDAARSAVRSHRHFNRVRQTPSQSSWTSGGAPKNTLYEACLLL